MDLMLHAAMADVIVRQITCLMTKIFVKKSLIVLLMSTKVVSMIIIWNASVTIRAVIVAVGKMDGPVKTIIAFLVLMAARTM